MRLSPLAVAGMAAFGLVGWALTGAGLVHVAIAALAAGTLMKVGLAVLAGLAKPPDPPPPAGELRRVRLDYRCNICGTEVRMTAAIDEDPEPPRHCLEDMQLVAPIME